MTNMIEQCAIDPIETEDDLLNPPPILADIAYHGILKDICDTATKHSEASPVAVAANVISSFAAMLGRAPFQYIGDGLCHARPYFLLCGRTGKARKGTSEFTPRLIFNEIERLLSDDINLQYSAMQRSEGGLSTGEGLGWAIRDEIHDRDGEVIDEGVSDKRLYVVEAEFASAMACAARERNTLSSVIRTAWDGRTIAPMVKNAAWSASNPHILITGHITSQELIGKMTAVDAYSGFLNRFIVLHIVRNKLVALPSRTPEGEIQRLAGIIHTKIVPFLKDGLQSQNTISVTLSPTAINLWCAHYKALTKEDDGLPGALLVRSEIYCRMLAMIFALLDGVTIIEPQHFQAVFAWIDYWKASVKYIFQTVSDKVDSEKLDEHAKEIYEFIKANQGCSRSQITSGFRNKKLNASEITKTLNHLLSAAPPTIRQESKPRVDGKLIGKPSTVFFTL